jgi:ribosomal protein S27E
MNAKEAQERAEEQLRESDGWISLTQRFFSGEFAAMTCPHCSRNLFEYMIHQRASFTLRCQTCGRFTHGRGVPSWVVADEQSDGKYILI